MNPIYNSIIGLYSFGADLAALRSAKVKKMIDGQKRAVATLREKLAYGDRPVWFHAASLGEFEQGRPMIERLRREHPERKIVLSFFSPSGYEVRKNYDKVDAVVYLPFDKKKDVDKFLDALNPAVAIFIKYEIWPNYLEALSQRNIPTYLISAIFRRSQIFFKPLGAMMRNVLKSFSYIFVQDEDSVKLLSGIGIDNVTVAGDTRFDRVTDVMNSTVDIPGMSQFNKGRGADLIFGSSWREDEQYYIEWLNNNPTVTFIIAPHEFDDERLKKMRDSINGNVVYLSQYEKMFSGDEQSPRSSDPSMIRGIIVDSFGKLSSLYRFARVAYIGGGVGVGIHNINEAAVYGMPIVFGPQFSKFKEARDLVKRGGAFACKTKADVHDNLSRLTLDESAQEQAGKIAGEYIKENIGASDRIYPEIFK